MSRISLLFRTLFTLVILFISLLGKNSVRAQDSGCDKSLSQVYSALSRVQAAWNLGDNDRALEALAEARTILESLEAECSQQTAILPELPLEEECAASQWEIIPTGVYTSPGTDGFKNVLVTLAFQNNSPYWGTFSGPRETDDIYITTEGGFQYNALGTSLRWSDRAPIPPGFAGSEFTDRWDSFQLVLDFSVAESQNHFVVTIPRLEVHCLHPNGEWIYDHTEPLMLDLDKNIRTISFPTSQPDAEFKDITKPIEIPGKGMFELLEIARDENLVLRFTFTNASAGYATDGYIRTYVVGNDGLYVGPDAQYELYYSAGPGQTETVEVRYPVEVQTTDSFKLIWIPDVGLPEIYEIAEASTAEGLEEVNVIEATEEAASREEVTQEAAKGGNPAVGEQIFSQTCSGCHGETDGAGPARPGLGERAATRVEGMSAEEFIHQSIVDPSAYVAEGFGDIMPQDYEEQFSPEEIDSLVAYLLTQ